MLIHQDYTGKSIYSLHTVAQISTAYIRYNRCNKTTCVKCANNILIFMIINRAKKENLKRAQNWKWTFLINNINVKYKLGNFKIQSQISNHV